MSTTAVSLVKAWPSRTERHLLHQMLRAAGMPPDSIAPWLVEKTRKSIHSYAAEVLQWVNAFESATQRAFAWHQSRHTLKMSTFYEAHGWGIQSADLLQTAIFLNALHLSTPFSDEVDWVKSGLPPAFVLKCLELDITDHFDGMALQACA